MNLDSIDDWVRTQYTSQVTPDLDGNEVTLFGWVQEVRDLGGLRFIILQDREGTVQVTIPKKRVSPEVLTKSDALQKRFSLGIKGTVKKTNMTKRGVEVVPSDIKIFSTATEQLPIDITGKTPANIEARLDARPLDLTLESSLAAFKIQHVALQAIRSFLFDKNFMEAHSPRIIASATEGGAELFCIDYFGQKAYLAQSPQLYKEELTLSFENVFEVGPFFRAEESHTRRHLSEFTSVDVEMAFANADNVMELLEQTINHTVSVVKEKCQTELTLLDHTLEVPTLPLRRLTYTQVLEDLKAQGVDIPWGEDITTDAFRVLGKIYPGFYFITDWPTHAKAFYIKPQDNNPQISEGFDLMYGYIELTSGGTRICDKTQLIERLKEKGLNPDSFKMHLQAFDYGMPPHAGWAIGLERLTMILTGIKNIREVTLYPRDRIRLTP
ncbi:MAG: aspartate--tRNA(Asn) ligase [Nitrososphaerota archaeon]|jgi:aspartyl-tRNA synthetase|uniref:aspartate--tRNA(Asn) ligase n=1 Tax=Candidatus Bathycorpusculum sp. TaxID=2994959 RepID=UPI0028236153|nr:aspartate--tRNA(Asn) ligase [Candidatus Termitimicrobium sp.]MCL2432737.1 aspartate--tRNA(Asn) ligase [Candidatus Termitimicrobium sp.]MDR0493771.1 aspartate--tRNA(Asn) ligase [Nitrososphaerota archaeon]